MHRNTEVCVPCLQTKKQKVESAKEAKAASESQQPAKPKKGMSKAEREAEKHRKKTAERPRKGKNTLMEVCHLLARCCRPAASEQARSRCSEDCVSRQLHSMNCFLGSDIWRQSAQLRFAPDR